MQDVKGNQEVTFTSGVKNCESRLDIRPAVKKIQGAHSRCHDTGIQSNKLGVVHSLNPLGDYNLICTN